MSHPSILARMRSRKDHYNSMDMLNYITAHWKYNLFYIGTYVYGSRYVLDLNIHMEFFLINIFYCVCGMHNVIVYVVTVSTFYLYFGYLLRMTD